MSKYPKKIVISYSEGDESTVGQILKGKFDDLYQAKVAFRTAGSWMSESELSLWESIKNLVPEVKEDLHGWGSIVNTEDETIVLTKSY